MKGFYCMPISFAGLLCWLTAIPLLAAEPIKTEVTGSHNTLDDESARFFDSPSLVQLEITISEESARKLASSPREYVTARVREAGSPEMQLGIHLKGRYGSFQHLS